VPARKKGKLPHKIMSKKYTLEYVEEEVEIHKDAIEKGRRVIIADDRRATGGMTRAVADLFESIGGKVVGVAFLIELTDFKGRDKLKEYEIDSLLKY